MEIPRVKVRSFFEEASNIHVRNESTVVGAKRNSPTLILPHLEEEKENEEEEKEEEESHQVFPAGGPESEQKAWNMEGRHPFSSWPNTRAICRNRRLEQQKCVFARKRSLRI